MTTIRRQARVAATRPYANQSGDPHEVIRAAVAGAEAASDLWEQEVRKWKALLRELAFVGQQGTFIDDDSAVVDRFEAALVKAWEALDGN
jgi:hypothetical protein